MSRDDFTQLKPGIVKRKTKRRLGLFIDGTGLDRATRRLDRKVDLSRLVAGISEGLPAEIARYYTLVPYEDDARQFAFLDAVERAGLEVVIKRLPPKGVKRQVSMDVHIATDLISYGYGFFANRPHPPQPDGAVISPATRDTTGRIQQANGVELSEGTNGHSAEIKRIAVVVCPTREVSYAIYMSHQLHVETHLADFGLYGSSDGWKGVDRWVDLSTSETIWRG